MIIGIKVSQLYICLIDIEILSAGELGAITLGIVPYPYPLAASPGWAAGSIGYHADDGKFVSVYFIIIIIIYLYSVQL